MTVVRKNRQYSGRWEKHLKKENTVGFQEEHGVFLRKTRFLAKITVCQ